MPEVVLKLSSCAPGISEAPGHFAINFHELHSGSFVRFPFVPLGQNGNSVKPARENASDVNAFHSGTVSNLIVSHWDPPVGADRSLVDVFV